MKKRLLNLFLTICFSAVTLFAQKDTVYLVTNGVTYSQMPANFISLDTFNQKVDSMSFSNLLIGGSATATFSDTVGTAYNRYFIRYTVNELQGGNSGFLSVDTNGTQSSFTALSTVTGIFLDDSLEIGSGGTIDFVLSAASSATALQIQGEIYHETTFILIRPKALRTVYFDTHNQTIVNKSVFTSNNYTVDSTSYDTLYSYNSGVQNIRATMSTYSETIPNTYNKYIVSFDMIHAAGAYDFTVDTNNTTLYTNIISVNSQSDINAIVTIDSFVLKSSDVITFNISNAVSSNGRYQVTVDIIHTVDTIFFNSNTTDINSFEKEAVTFTVYPNPTHDYLKVSHQKGLKGRYRIYDINSKLVKQGWLEPELDVSNLPSGLYLLHLPDWGVSKKFLKK